MVDDAKERLYMKDLYCSYYTESDEITSSIALVKRAAEELLIILV